MCSPGGDSCFALSQLINFRQETNNVLHICIINLSKKQKQKQKTKHAVLMARIQIPVLGLTGPNLGWPGALKRTCAAVNTKR